LTPDYDVLDGAILAGRIHRLKYEQQRPAVLGVSMSCSSAST
jgi:hypothetical protein